MILRYRSHQLARALAAAVAAAALAAPPALARIDPPATAGFSSSDATPTVTAESAVNPPVVVRTVDDGFDWGAAAIGAGGAGALVALVLLGGSAITARHQVRVPQ
jgi:hypothetical protein